MTDIGGLPDHMQLMVVGSVIVISSVWGVTKFLKPFLDNLTPKSKPSQETEAVVISAALADSRIIADLTKSIDSLKETVEENSKVKEKSNIIMHMLYEAMVRSNMK